MSCLPGDAFIPVGGVAFRLGTVSVLFLEHVFHLFDTVLTDEGVDPIGRGQLRRVEEFAAAIAGDGFLVFHDVIIPDDGLAHKLYSRKLGST